MITRKKIVPPVTPRIVQNAPRQQLFQYALLLGMLFFAAWLGYFYGRDDTPASTSLSSDTAVSEDQAQRLSALQRERDELRAQVEELQRSVEQSNRALQTAQSRLQTLQAAQRAASQPDNAGRAVIAAVEDTPVTASQPVQNTLGLENVRIIPTESADTYRVEFSVTNASGSGRVTGTVWIAVNGHTNRQPVRLSLKKLSPGSRPFVNMGFEQQQDIHQEVTLPAGFLPKNILIEVKPYGDRYTGTSEKIAWELDS